MIYNNDWWGRQCSAKCDSRNHRHHGIKMDWRKRNVCLQYQRKEREKERKGKSLRSNQTKIGRSPLLARSDRSWTSLLPGICASSRALHHELGALSVTCRQRMRNYYNPWFARCCIFTLCVRANSFIYLHLLPRCVRACTNVLNVLCCLSPGPSVVRCLCSR